MWLLNTCTWEMRDFISHKQAPPYAVLSHTWGNEEVSFREWQYEPLKDIGKKEGFNKISSCCRQAAEDGFEWVWVDTCCIDKSSSAELSEAINSMFQWYHSAAVCYAYLSDVQDDIGLNLARSYWVTRGWTLQELIAPSEVIFFSSEWQVLGTRSALSAQISAITRIQEPFLLGQSLNEASIAQRMSWAAGRDTSREEDEAYCLLGIFDVNMPLIYGEGRKAFGRLQEILTREYPEDHSLFAWGKIASQISGRVSHIEQIWGSKAIKYRPDKATKSFPGLFAESPGDFRGSGDIVLAPDANFFFHYKNGAVGVVAFVGKAVEAKMPLSWEGRMVLHLDGLPIVIMHFYSSIILTCGLWNESRTTFQYATIPVINDTGLIYRGSQLVIGQRYTTAWGRPVDLVSSVKAFRIAPLSQPSLRSGNIIIRKIISKYPHHSSINTKIKYFTGYRLHQPSDSFRGHISSVVFHINDRHGVAIVLVRLDSLDHPHENPRQGKSCGQLRAALRSFVLIQPGETEASPFNTLTRPNDLEAPVNEEPLTPSLVSGFGAIDSSANVDWKNPRNAHDMIPPHTEWRISIIGVANIYISVERIFFDECDSDNDPDDDDAPHRFLDAVDIVMNRYTGNDGITNGE